MKISALEILKEHSRIVMFDEPFEDNNYIVELSQPSTNNVARINE